MQPKYSKQDLANPLDLLDLSLITEKDDFQYIYRPNDDSYLLIDTLCAELAHIIAKQPLSICEIGSGSGFIINNLSSAMVGRGYSAFVSYCTDINIDACLYTRKASNRFGVHSEVVLCRTLSCIREKTMDVLVCNPPYVVTDEDETRVMKERLKMKTECLKRIVEEGIEAAEERKRVLREVNCSDAAWVGGQDGMMYIEEIVRDAYRVLRKDGWFYLLVIEDNHPDSVVKMCEDIGFVGVEVLSYRKKFNEEIFILKMVKK